MRLAVGLIVAALFAAAMCFHLVVSRPVSARDMLTYGRECSEWISAEVNQCRGTEIGDAWRKRGALVFEILAEEADRTSRSIYLCVFEPDTGRMRKPSAFSSSEWSRPSYQRKPKGPTASERFNQRIDDGLAGRTPRCP